MKVLDLFCGLKGFSQGFEGRGHEIVTLDINPDFEPSYVQDIRNVSTDYIRSIFNGVEPDIILASPPCERFSVMSISHYWQNNKPGPEAIESLDLVIHTLNLIYKLRPRYWFLENPRGMLRTIIGNFLFTVYYAQFGEDRLKPTDIWGRHPPSFKKVIITDKRLLKYTPAPRGSRAGTKGMKNAAERAKIPFNLSRLICVLCERELQKDNVRQAYNP